MSACWSRSRPFPIIGYVLAIRQPENAIGWVMLGMGVFMGLPFASYGIYAIHGGPGGRDLGLLLEAHRPAGVDPRRRDPRDLPPPAVPRRTSAVAAMEVVRPDPRRGSRVHLPRHPGRPRADRGRRAPRGAEPAGARIPAPLPGGRPRLDPHHPHRGGRVVGESGASVPPVQRHRATAAPVARHGARPSWPPPTRPASCSRSTTSGPGHRRRTASGSTCSRTSPCCRSR